MKVAIIGAGVTGLSCALECERLGIHPDIFERDHTVGWEWQSVSFWPSMFYRSLGDLMDRFRKDYKISITAMNECKNIIMKSPTQTASIDGNLGYFIARGKGEESLESQLRRVLRQSAVHVNHNMDYKDLSKKYDWVVVATGNDRAARELGVWEDEGVVHMIGGLLLGKFNPESSTIYFDTTYAGSGYARLTPFSSTQALVGLYTIGLDRADMIRLFSRFLEKENLAGLELTFTQIPPPFTTGKVKKYRVGNILLAGRAAGLTERLIGVGAPEAIVSGVMAARAIVNKDNYAKTSKTVRKHVENISSFRKIVEKYNNDDFDKLIAVLDLPPVKQLIYNTGLDFVDIAGRVIKHLTK